MFFKANIDDIKNYISVNGDMKFSELLSYLKEVDRTIFKEYLGAEFITELQAAFDEMTSFTLDPEDKQSVLLDLLRASSAKFALARWIPEGSVSIDNTGIRIISTDTQKQAFEWQINRLTRSLNNSGYQALGSALEHLESNIDDFETYKSSDNYKENQSLLINSATEFSKYTPILSNSAINFIRLRPIIKKVQDFEVQGILLPTLYDKILLDLKSGDGLEGVYLELVNKLKPAIASLTIAKAINDLAAELTMDGFLNFDNTGSNGDATRKQADDKTLNRLSISAHNDGLNYLKTAKEYLVRNKTSFDEYTSDSRYIDPSTSVETNDPSNPFFAAL